MNNLNLNRNISIKDFKTKTRFVASKANKIAFYIGMTIMSAEIILLTIICRMYYSPNAVLLLFLNHIAVIVVMIIMRNKYTHEFTKTLYIIPPYTYYGIFLKRELQDNIESITRIYPKLLTKVELEDVVGKQYFNCEPVKLEIVKSFTWAKKSVGDLFAIETIELIVTVVLFSDVSCVECYLKEVNTDELNIKDINLVVYNALAKVARENKGSLSFDPTTDKKKDMIKTLNNKLFDEINKYGISILGIDVRYPGQYDINIV